jgi:Swiss Army Knife protein, DSP-PTPase phosphatase domain
VLGVAGHPLHTLRRRIDAPLPWPAIGSAGKYRRQVTSTWDPAGPGVLRLPSGRLVRGRGLRQPLPPGERPSLGVYLLGTRPPETGWEAWWLRWPDFGLPADRARARTILHRAWEQSATRRVEIACAGGRGRTGTALACLAVIDGVPADQAVAFVRQHYARRAVETPWQRHYAARFPARG